MSPRFSPEEFWSKILTLLNDNNGSITPTRFENVFGVRFAPSSSHVDATSYEIRAGKDWFFDAHLVAYHDNYVSAVGAERNGAHLEWYVGWSPESFASSSTSRCITADRVRATLLVSGWSSPWLKWGMIEEQFAQSRIAQSRGALVDPGLPPLGPSGNFFRQTDEDSGHRDRLPQGRISSTGDLADSCVTAIEVFAKP